MALSNIEKKSLSSGNSFTDPLHTNGSNLPVFVHSEGTWSGIITIQIKHDGDDEWIDMNTGRHSVNFETYAEKLPINCDVRAGFKQNEYGSGTATVRVMQ